MTKIKGLLSTLCVFAIIFSASMGSAAAADASHEKKDTANIVTTAAELSEQKTELIVSGKNSLKSNNRVAASRAVNNITSSVSQISGNLTSANQIDFYYDYDTDQYVELYLASDEVPQAHRLLYGFAD